MEQANVLIVGKIKQIVDDEKGIRFQLKWALNRDYQVVLAADSNIALQRIREKQPNVVLLDIALSSVDNTGGLRLLDAIQEIDPSIKVVMITDHDSHSYALEAIARGA
jgi:DNA-binding NtrC family response regulator